jgi:acyl-CoA hydrolase
MMARQQNISNLEAQLRSEEPKYDEIMKGLNDAIQNLPVSRYNKLQKAYNDGNPEALPELFKEMQKSYYSKSI